MFNLTNRDIAARCNNHTTFYRGFDYYRTGHQEHDLSHGADYLEATVQGRKRPWKSTSTTRADSRCGLHRRLLQLSVTANILPQSSAAAQLKRLNHRRVQWNSCSTDGAKPRGSGKRRSGSSYNQAAAPHYRGVSFRVSLKVGETKTYVVKDIGKFITAVLRSKSSISVKSPIAPLSSFRLKIADHRFLRPMAEFEQNNSASTSPLREGTGVAAPCRGGCCFVPSVAFNLH